MVALWSLGEDWDRKTGTGLAGKYLLSEGKWPVGLGHDHFAIAVNIGGPICFREALLRYLCLCLSNMSVK
jgi:hypothetical protein